MKRFDREDIECVIGIVGVIILAIGVMALAIAQL